MGVKKTPKRFNKEQIRQIEGRNAVREALRANSPITQIYIEENVRLDDRISEIFNLAKMRGITIERTFSKKLKRLSKTANHHQGIIAFAQPIKELDLKDILRKIEKENRVPFFLILANVLYEQNLGAVLRSAETCGVDAVILNNRAPQLTAVVEKTAVGAGEYIPLIHTNLFSALRTLKEEGIKIYGAIEGENKSIYRCDFTGGTAIIIGAEDTGISNPINKEIDQLISIPMLGKIESLNMSVAAALCMYEVVRQRKYSK